MRYVLSARYLRILRQFAQSRVLVVFDFDGTLAPMVADRTRATLRPATKWLLQNLTASYPCVVVSGRSRDDVRHRLKGVRVLEIAGNHGIEPWSTSRKIERAVQRWKPLLEKKLSRFSGLALEDKRYSLALHYRHVRRKKQIWKAIAQVARALRDVRLVGGVEVANFLPRGGPNKGLALEQARTRFGCDSAIYVGDDDTDEDAFALGPSRRLLSIRVGPSRSSLADYYIRSQKEVDRLIHVLIELRSAPPNPGKANT